MMKKATAAILALTLSAGLFAGCSGGNAQSSSDKSPQESQTESADGKVDTSKEVNLVMYLYGSEGVANQSILNELNKKLKESINATLEIKYIDWNNIPTKYPLLWASGEEFDMSYVASNAPVPYATLAKQEVLVDITNMLDTYAPTLKSAINNSAWNSMKVGGKIYGVPSTYSEFTAYGFVTRKDILEKAGLEKVSSIEDMEKYMDAALSAGFVPLNGSSNLAIDLYRMFIATTSDWLDAPGIPESEMYLALSPSNGNKIFHPAFTEEFEKFALKMAEWSKKGYWSKDVLSAAQDDKRNAFIKNGKIFTASQGSIIE
jgi:putative aldouronate transport system substrate-binding protein